MTERIRAADLKEALAKSSNKYGAEKVKVQGITFDSKREAQRWLLLRQWERSGQITDLQRQVVVYLEGMGGPLLTRTGKRMKITLDFSYIDLRDEATAGTRVYEDAKGMATRDYEVRRAVAAAQGVEIVEV